MTERTVKCTIPLNDLSSIKTPANFIITAPTNCGKSLLVKYLFYKELNKRFNYVFVLSGSIFNDDYDFINPEYKYSDIDLFKSLINKVMDSQIDKKLKKEPLDDICFILDDIVGVIDKQKKDNIELFDLLFTRGRHINISSIALIQSVLLLSTTIRYNTKYIIFYGVAGKQVDLIYELGSHCLASKKQLQVLLDNIAQNHRFICLDVHNPSKEGCIKVLRSEYPIPPFVLVAKGSPIQVPESN